MAASTLPQVPSPSTSELTSLETVVGSLQQALAAYRQDPAATQPLVNTWDARREAARQIAGLPKQFARDALLTRTAVLLAEIRAAGLYEISPAAADLERANSLIGQGIAGLCAATLLASAWRLTDAPALDRVPEPLQDEYARWLYQVPYAPLDAQEIARFFSFWQKRQGELDQWLGQNPGSRVVKIATTAFFEALATPSYLWTHQEPTLSPMVKSRLLLRHFLRGKPEQALDPISRDGRRLHVGFVASDFGPRSSTYTTLACFEHLDQQRFEISLFALQDSPSVETAHCRGRANNYSVLPAEHSERVAALAGAGLDAVVFGDDLASEWNDLSRLTLHRLAPLQIAAHRFSAPVEAASIDLQLGIAETRAENLTTRGGILRGDSCSYAFPPIAELPDKITARQILGLPEEPVIFASIADRLGFSSGNFALWCSALKRVPESRLLVGINLGNESESWVKAWSQSIDRHLAAAGIDHSRIFLLPFSSQSEDKLHLLLRAADCHIGGAERRDACWAARSLSLGVPSLTVASEDRHASAALLRQMGLQELVATSATHLGEIVGALCADPQSRDGFAAKIQSAIEAEPAFIDTLASSDAFGALVEAAFDEMTVSGPAGFRSPSQPVVACESAFDIESEIDAGESALAVNDLASASFKAQLALRTDPRHPRARRLHGQTLLAEFRPDRAITYLLAALPHYSAEVDFWCVLADALHRNGQTNQAVEALEASLQLEGDQTKPLFMILDLAESSGAQALAQEALDALRKLVPTDPRVLQRSL